MTSGIQKKSVALASEGYGAKLHDLSEVKDRARPLDGDGDPPDHDEMERRVKALEDAMVQVRETMAVVRSNYATKEDLHKELNSQTWKLITWTTGICTLLVAATFFIATKI
ncbi:hypothetical protein EGT29_19640 [Pigmentiphaga sp. H8]|uniref:hypothetical protein n=1 Tax=Pigmentiphaga sp. H8 TaxID=2488560 RepID=UPI000F5B32ED|nr:hypothetical protein [Pigmentiphaga sp. H8]AZG09892.1 hypothetical protein EGT29_19640 [Pigmentiphaga sp. H8]